MYCPKCGSQNGDDVLYCRGCGTDLGVVRSITNVSQTNLPQSRFEERLAERRNRRLLRRGIDGTEDPLTFYEKAIEMNSLGIRGLLIGLGFAFISSVVYSAPPVGGIFWLLPVAFAIFFLGTSVSRFVQAASIRKLARSTGRDSAQPAALADTAEPYVNTPRSIYETDDLPPQPHSVTDATTRHLGSK